MARRWLIWSSLIATGVTFAFFLIAPAVNYPLTWDQAKRVFEIVLPVFLGYLGAATHFLFQTGQRARQVHPEDHGEILGLLIRGPIIIFGIASFSILFAFGFSNRAKAPDGVGMSVDTLASWFSAALGLLAVTSNVAVAFLFSKAEKASSQ